MNEVLTIKKEDCIRDFLHIVKVINRYYDNPKEKQSEGFLFRKSLVEKQSDDMTIDIRKIGEYEFLIECNNFGVKEVWLHVDGIQQERDDLLKKEIVKNPIFDIVAMTDVYNRSKDSI
jgi:hypothetical protein